MPIACTRTRERPNVRASRTTEEVYRPNLRYCTKRKKNGLVERTTTPSEDHPRTAASICVVFGESHEGGGGQEREGGGGVGQRTTQLSVLTTQAHVKSRRPRREFVSSKDPHSTPPAKFSDAPPPVPIYRLLNPQDIICSSGSPASHPSRAPVQLSPCFCRLTCPKTFLAA